MINKRMLLRYCFSQKGQKRHFFKIGEKVNTNTPIVYPKQYPNNLIDASPLIPRGRPTRLLTPKS